MPHNPIVISSRIIIMKPTITILKSLRGLALALAAISSLHATTNTWTQVGAPGTDYGGGNWSVSANWDSNGVPTNDATADLVFIMAHAGWPSYTVDPGNLTPSSTNWSIHSLTFVNSGTQADWGNSYFWGSDTSRTLTIGAGGITQNQLTTPYIGIPVIATTSQTWNINNFSANYTGGIELGGGLTLNNGVTITKNTGTATISTPPTAWFDAAWGLPTQITFDNTGATTTTVGTGAFLLAGGGFTFNGVAQYGRLGTNTLTISDSQNARKNLTFNDNASGTFANNINFVGALGGTNSNLNIIYGNSSVPAGTTLTFTGTLSGAITGGQTNGVGFIAPIVNGVYTADDRYNIVFQGNGSGLVRSFPDDPTYGNLQIASGVVILNNANAMGSGNNLSFFVGANANQVTNLYSGLLATSGSNVSGPINVRPVVNGSNQHNPVVELGLSGTGSVTFTGPITLDNWGGSAAQYVQSLKLTAPTGGTAIFNSQISDASSSPSDSSYVPVTILGGGTVALNGNNNYKGTTAVRGGTLLLGNSNALGFQASSYTSPNQSVPAISLGDTVVAPAGGSARVATTSEVNTYWWNNTYSAGVLTLGTAVTTIDGVTLNVGDRILYKDAQAPERNGVYTYTDSTHWTRSTDLNTASAFVQGLRINVTSGTINAGQNFYLYTGLVTPEFPTPVLGDNSGNPTSAMFVFNPDVPSNIAVAILTNGPLNISRNVNVTNNLSTGQSILGGNTTGTSTFSGKVSLSKDLAVQAATGGTVIFSGDIAGSNNVFKQGAGTVVFNTSKSYTGATNVTAGTLEVDNTIASSTVNVSSGATLQGTGTIPNGVNISGILAPGVSGNGTLTVSSASFASGSSLSITINGYSSTQLVSTGALNLSGAALTGVLTGLGWAQPSYVIAQGSPLTGTFASVPSGYAVTYTSTQAILSSTVAYYYVSPTGSDTLNNGLSQASPFATIAHAATDLKAGYSILIAAGTYSSAVTIPKATPANAREAIQNNANQTVTVSGAVTLSNNLTISSSSGATFNFTGNISSTNGIITEGSGSVVFTGNKTYTGTTSVTGGTLSVNGSLASSALTVNSGATLAGTGTITNGVTISGVVNPGTSGIGTLTVGTGSFAIGGNLTIGVNGTTNGLLKATGALSLSGSSLTVAPTGSGFTQASYVIAQGAPLTGTFSTVPDGYAVSYTSTQATLTVVPAYYVSASNGSDTVNNGQSVTAPFATISKAASVIGTAIATAQANHTTPFSTTCFIRGGTYHETVNVPYSGTVTSPVTFKAYNNEAVTISGTDPITGWVLESPNIYKASAMPAGWTSLGTGNQVFQNGVMQPEAGWPKKDNTNGTLYPWRNSTLQHPAPYNALGDWSYVDSASYTSVASFVDAQLPPRSDGYWNGAKLHIMAGYGWVMQHNTVTNYTESTKTIVTDNGNVVSGGAYTIMPGNEFFLTGIKGEMSTPGEWFFDTNTGVIDFWSTSPPVGVEVKSRKYGFNILGQSYINLVNLSFIGCTIETYQNNPLLVSTNCTFNGLTMKYLSHDSFGNADPGLFLGPGCVLRNSELAYTPLSMVSMFGYDIHVINNNIHHSGYYPGGEPAIGAWGWNNYTPYRNLISHNSIHTTGYSGIGGVGMSGIIEYNNVYDAMSLGTDGGVIYSNNYAANTVVRYNLLHDSTGATGHYGNGVEGFYLDCENSDWIVHHNIIWNLPTAAFQFNARTNFNMVFNNTCWNTGGSLNSAFVGDGPTGDNFYNNLFGTPPNGMADPAANPDFRYNITTDPSYVNAEGGNFQLQSTSPAIDAGTLIPGITDGYQGAAPDIGAQEYGAADWTLSAGYSATPPSPDPVYTAPAYFFADHVVDGSFESGSLSNWTVASGSNLGLTNSSAWYDPQQRSGYFAVQFGGGSSEISQVVTGLQPNTRYTFYAGLLKNDPSAVVNIGVRGYGYPTVQASVPTTGVWQQTSYDPVARMHSVTFITGQNSTTATIFVDVTRAPGSFVAPWDPNSNTFPTVAAASVYLGNYNNTAYVDEYYPSNGVYLDDLSVVQTNLTADSDEDSPILQYTLNQSSGLIVNDSSVYQRNGSIINTTTPAWQTGVNGNGLGFDGVATYVVSPAITTPTSLTVSAWAKAPANASPSNASTWNSNGSFVSKRPSFVLGPVSGTNNVAFTVYNGISGVPVTLTWTPPSGFDITQWHHYAGVFALDAQQMLFYVDGSQVASQVAGFPINADTWSPATGELVTNVGKIYIGRDDYWLDNTRVFNGVLDNVEVFDRVLSPQQIQNIVSGDPSQLLHLTFDEHTGSNQAWDTSLYANTSTLYNLNTSTSWVQGIINGSLHFDGVAGYVQTPSIAMPTDLTVECWAKSDVAAWENTNGSFLSATPTFQFAPVAGTCNVQFTVNTSTTPVNLLWTAPLGFQVNAWHHYAASYASATQVMTIYVDGAPVATGAGPTSLVQTNTPITMGALFQGTLDDLSVYSRALAWNEVLTASHQIFNTPYETATVPTSNYAQDGLPDVWKLKYGLNPYVAYNPNDDSLSHDGVGLLMKYATGQSPYTDNPAANPTVSTAVNPADSQTYLTYSYLSRTDYPQLTYTVQISTDLVNWTTPGTTLLSAVPTGDGITQLVTVRILPYVTNGTSDYHVRLQITAP